MSDIMNYLDYITLTLGLIGVLLSIYNFLVRKNAEHELRKEFLKIAIKKNEIQRMEKLRNTIKKGEIPDEKLLSAYINILERSSNSLNKREVESMRYIISKASPANYSYILKLLSELLSERQTH